MTAARIVFVTAVRAAALAFSEMHPDLRAVMMGKQESAYGPARIADLLTRRH
ncbi:hypothetical protein [Streptosporangium sandarakinum]|uniref:Uncharacterized protein n=1 Tax=Streptosporangium sandarakinum TaxID=1260955 RepID=A0A852URZ4_9ACTN|nr:hypothetical protein [Streptosporangium sandarakinum]NYF38196.1 hypothetical protein [Streptosporangium sandarakinum]